MDADKNTNQANGDSGYKEYTLEDWLLIALMLGLFVVVSIQVWGRLIFHAGGLAWTDELSRLILVGLVYISIGVVSKRDLHFKIDRIPSLPKIVYKIFDVISILVTLATMIILAVYGTRLMMIVNRHLKMTQGRHAKMTHLIYGKRAKNPKNVNRGLALPC